MVLKISRCLKLVACFALLSFGQFALSDNIESRRLSVLTWNVWFDSKSGVTRYPSIFDAMTNISPDIVFLQEVTPHVIQAIQKHTVIKNYHLLASQDAVQGYGQAFLTRQRLLLKEEYMLSSQYGRDALFGLFELGPRDALILINVHLESGLRESKARDRQIKAIRNDLLPLFQEEAELLYPEKTIKHVIWAGDFNLGYTELADGIESYIDVGKKFKDNTPTYHINNNKLASYTASLFEDSARLDRVFVSRSNGISILAYKVMNSDLYASLSDHYPIKVSLAFEAR